MIEYEPPTAEPTRPDEWWDLLQQVQHIQRQLKRLEQELEALESMLRVPF